MIVGSASSLYGYAAIILASGAALAMIIVAIGYAGRSETPVSSEDADEPAKLRPVG